MDTEEQQQQEHETAIQDSPTHKTPAQSKPPTQPPSKQPTPKVQSPIISRKNSVREEKDELQNKNAENHNDNETKDQNEQQNKDESPSTDKKKHEEVHQEKKVEEQVAPQLQHSPEPTLRGQPTERDINQMLPINIQEINASSQMPHFARKIVKQIVSRALAVSELEKVWAETDSYILTRMTDHISQSMHMGYFTYDVRQQYKTKMVPIEPIPIQQQDQVPMDSFRQQIELEENDLSFEQQTINNNNNNNKALTQNFRSINSNYSFIQDQGVYYSQQAKGEVPLTGFDCGFMEVMDMEDDLEPIPPPIDSWARKYLKVKSPEKRTKFNFNTQNDTVAKPLDQSMHSNYTNIIGASPNLKINKNVSQHNQSVISGGTVLSKRLTSKRLSNHKVSSMKQFEVAKINHLTERGSDYNQVKLPEEEKPKDDQDDHIIEEKEFEIQQQRRKVIGEEKRIMEEMKRQHEVEMMMEIMNKNKTSKGKVTDLTNVNITFDYEGKIIQIQKPNEVEFPDTLTNPKIKFKQAVVQSNFLKEALDQQYQKMKKKKDGKSKISSEIEKSVKQESVKSAKQNADSLDRGSLQSSQIQITKKPNKRSNKIIDQYSLPNPTGNIKPKPMGSNFNELIPKPGITVLENGKVKQNKQPIESANQISLEGYYSMKQDTSLSHMAESRIQQMGEKSFSLPHLNAKSIKDNKDSFMQLGTLSNLDYSIQDTSIMTMQPKSVKNNKGSISRLREEALQDLLDLQQQKPGFNIRLQQKRERASSEVNQQDPNKSVQITSNIKPLYKKERIKILMSEHGFHQDSGGKGLQKYKSSGDLNSFIGGDTISNYESMDKLNQFNKYLITDSGIKNGGKIMVGESQSTRNIIGHKLDKQYLLNSKELQKKKEKLVIQQSHFIERLTGNNQSHLAKKLITTPRNIKLLAPLALKRQGRDNNLIKDQQGPQPVDFL